MLTPILWVSFGFLALLVIFLIAAFFFIPEPTISQYNLLRFLCALSAAFAAGFFAGDALFKMDGTLSNGMKLTISGTAGFAVFFTVFFFYPSVAPTAKPGFSFDLPNGWTFQQAVIGMAQVVKGMATFTGFADADLKTILPARTYEANDATEAISSLKMVAPTIPDYTVTRTQNDFSIVKK